MKAKWETPGSSPGSEKGPEPWSPEAPLAGPVLGGLRTPAGARRPGRLLGAGEAAALGLACVRCGFSVCHGNKNTAGGVPGTSARQLNACQ